MIIYMNTIHTHTYTQTFMKKKSGFLFVIYNAYSVEKKINEILNREIKPVNTNNKMTELSSIDDYATLYKITF